MRTQTLIGIPGLAISLLLSGCASHTTNPGTSTPTANATVNLVVTDTPPTDVTVLTFEIQITGATLQPGNVSLLNRPVTVDLAQLVSDTGFLASTVIDSGTYTSLTLTYANPQVTILNGSAAPIVVAGQTCLAGAICTISPALNQASATISNGVFPLTVQADSETGLNLDLSVPDLLQSDLSISWANGNAVNLSLLPQPSNDSAQQAEIDDVFGTITAISGSQVSMTTAAGDSLVLNSGSSTSYNYPASVCSAAGMGCLSVGQVVTADLSLLGDGALALNSISYVGSSGSPFVKGLVLSVDTAAETPSAQVLVQRTENASAVDPGQIASVSLPSGTVYGIGTAAYPAVSGGTFAGASDLVQGQELILSVGSDLVSGSAPSFSAGSILLEPSQLVGRVASIDPSSSSLSINSLSGLFTWMPPVVEQMDIDTDGNTNFVGFTSASLSGLSAGQFIAAKGPLFNTTMDSGNSTMGAIQLRKRATGN